MVIPAELPHEENVSCTCDGHDRPRARPTGRRPFACPLTVSDSDSAAASQFALGLLAKVRACDGFRQASINYAGCGAVANAKVAFDAEGFVLAADGPLLPKVLLETLWGMSDLR